MPDRHKRVSCGVCKKWVRSNNLKRHMKTHKDLLCLSEEELEEELRSRHENQIAEEEQEQKRQKVVDTAKNIGVSVPEEMQDPASTNEGDVRNRLVKNNKVYLSRVKVGEIYLKNSI